MEEGGLSEGFFRLLRGHVTQHVFDVFDDFSSKAVEYLTKGRPVYNYGATNYTKRNNVRRVIMIITTSEFLSKIPLPVAVSKNQGGILSEIPFPESTNAPIMQQLAVINAGLGELGWNLYFFPQNCFQSIKEFSEMAHLFVERLNSQFGKVNVVYGGLICLCHTVPGQRWFTELQVLASLATGPHF